MKLFHIIFTPILITSTIGLWWGTCLPLLRALTTPAGPFAIIGLGFLIACTIFTYAFIIGKIKL